MNKLLYKIDAITFSYLYVEDLISETKQKRKPDLWETMFHFHHHLRAAFTHEDPKSAKKTDGLTVFLALLGFAHVKVLRKTFIKLTTCYTS